MNFTKMQAAGNDFILVDEVVPERDWPSLARDLCQRHYGIGADGLILVLPASNADFEMRVYNADGSEPESCGNGIRCFTRYVVEKGLVPVGKNEILLVTKAGLYQATVHYDHGKINKIRVSMGAPVFTPAKIPVILAGDVVDIMLDYPLTVEGEELSLNFVSMGNPHAVFFVSYPVADFPLERLGASVENHPIFPNRINFEVARIIDRENIEARIWERGVGETKASGTGACAIAVLAQRRGDVGNRVGIKLPGGVLDVEWDGRGEVFQSGPAEIVFTGDWPV